MDPTATITESLARLFQHTSKNPSDYLEITQMRNMSVIAKDTANSSVDTVATGKVATGGIVGSEGATANANTTTPLFSPPGTDLCDKVKATTKAKRKAKSIPTTAAPVATVYCCSF